jgi:outer membrane protein assembly factor BamB
MKSKGIWSIAVVSVAAFLVSCSSQTANTQPGPAGLAAGSVPDAGLTDAGGPGTLPPDGVQPWEELDSRGYVIPGSSGGSGASAINLGSEFVAGVERYLEGGDAADNGEATHLSSTSGTWSYAIYRIPLGGGEPGAVSVDANVTSGTGYYVGLADYGSDTWEWHGPFTDNHVRLDTADTSAGADYTSALGSAFVCVLVQGGVSCDVVGIGVNAVDPADTTAPPAPGAPMIAAVQGGLLLEWLPVVEGDLAGYRIYHNSQWFYDALGTGVQEVESLEGLTSHLLHVSGLTYLRISAVDISGNESPLSGLASATPLVGSAFGTGITVSAPSGRLNDAIAITAFGGDTYDFDLDGDGIYDITGSATATQDVDTSSLGLIRPHVRAYQSGVMTAQGGVSVVISGNVRPVANGYADPSYGPAPLTVDFTGTGTDPDGEIVMYSWDFDGNGSYDWSDPANSNPPDQVYNIPYMRNVKFRVDDDQGAYDVDTVSVQILAPPPGPNDPPAADLAVSQDRPLIGQQVSFDASASSDPDGSIVSYEWDFEGDGNWDAVGSAPTAVHTYATQLGCEARVRVTDNGGARDIAGVQLAVTHGPWTMRGHDTLHNGRSPYSGAQTNTFRWSYITGFFVNSSPAIGADGTVYVGSRDDNLYALNPDGSLKWSYATGDDVDSSPAIGADGTVYVGSNDNHLHAVNPDGSLKWSYATGSNIDSSPAVGADGTVYVGSQDFKLYALNPDGTLKWAHNTSNSIRSSPAIGTDGTVYFGIGITLRAVNPDGSEKWTYITEGFGLVYSSPAVGADGTVYVGSYDGSLYAVNDDGSYKWSYETLGSIASSPAIGADGTVYVGSRDNNLYALNPDGSLKWSYPTGDDVDSSPAIGADGVVYVGSDDNNMYAVNPNGGLKWSYPTGGDVYSSPAIGADGAVYVGSDDWKLYTVGP